MRWRSRVGGVKEARSVRGATRRLMYKESKVEEGLEGCPIFAAASDLPYKGCWRAGCEHSLLILRLACACISPDRLACLVCLGARSIIAERSPPPSAASVCAGIVENNRLFVYGSTAADQWFWLHCYLRIATTRPLARKGNLVFDFL
jgi:hypothetical protein